MTAQVVVMNKAAVALASDSSVSLTAGTQLRRSYLTAEKVFPLAPPHRLAVMHNGDTELLGAPYAVLLLEWLHGLDKPLAEVSDYARSFVEWVEAQAGMFDTESEDRHLRWMLDDYYRAIRSEVVRLVEERGASRDGSASILEEVAKGRADHLARLDQCPNLAGVDGAGYVEQRRTTVTEVVEDVFAGIERSEAADAQLRRVAADLIGAQEPFSTDADLVFVGFGDDQLFPASQVLTVRGVTDGKLKTEPGPQLTVTTTDGCYISPYAQTEAMHTFLSGYHRDFLDAAHERLAKVLGSVEGERDGDDDPHAALDDDFERLSWEEFIEPLVATVSGLPRVELARTAEALVGLQVLRKLTRAEADTVGGPVDVATITRADGFVWCRHKSMANGLGRP